MSNELRMFWRYLSAGERGVVQQRQGALVNGREVELEPSGCHTARNGALLSTQGRFDTLNPCALTTPLWPRSCPWYFSPASPALQPFSKVRARLAEGAARKGTTLLCKPVRLQSVPLPSESGSDQVLFSLSLNRKTAFRGLL